MKRVLCAALCLIMMFTGGCGENVQSGAAHEQFDAESIPQTASGDVSLTFSGENYFAEYKKCWDQQDIISGCFYITLQIENRGETEHVYALDDVYVDDFHCQSGTGVPVTAAAGKKVSGAFIVFCETPLDDVRKIEFKLLVRDYEAFQTIEESDVITVYPNV